MINIEKGQAPRELGDAIRGMRHTPGCAVDYSSLREVAKDAVMESLVREQHGICAYCMRRIEASHGSSIEHIIPQRGADGTRHSEESLDYSNMLAVCRPGDGTLTCDRSRGNMPMKVNPLVSQTLEGIRYGKNGSIHSADPEVDHDLDVPLNLNDPSSYLSKGRAETRKAVEAKVRRICSKGSYVHAANECERIRSALLAAERYVPCIGVQLYWLGHFIGKFRSMK